MCVCVGGGVEERIKNVCLNELFFVDKHYEHKQAFSIMNENKEKFKKN